MNTARIVVLTAASGTGGIAAYPASGSDGLTLPATHARASFIQGDPVGARRAPGRGNAISSIRYGDQSQTTAQK